MFLKIGHRGARAYEVENTLESYKRAIDLGANAIELDVRRSKDGKIIVIHDDNLKKVFGLDLNIHGATLAELKQHTGNRIPTLAEALRFIGEKVDKILVELKEEGYEKEVLKIIANESLTDRVIIVSFHEQALINIRKLDKSIETGLIYMRHKKPVAAAVGLGAQYLVPLYRFTHTKIIDDAHRHNLKVIVWTINTKKEIGVYRARDVDGIASDNPDYFDII